MEGKFLYIFNVSILTQKTVSQKISFNGVGIHTGKKVNLNILPASPNTGITFKRIDLKTNNIIYPNYANVVDTTLCTTISNEYGAKVSTIEHLMGALYGIGIDNAFIEIDAGEVPIMDGSAKPFVNKINEVGLKFSDQPIKIIKINQKIKFEDGEKFISIDKSNVSGDIEFEIKYNNELIGTQKNSISVYENNLNDIFNSRTFCLYEDVEKLKSMNLAQGGSLKNAIVVKGNMILNEEKLRNKKEFVNHKILDCMGDLFLSGYKIIGKVVCSQGGHRLTNELLRKVFMNNENFSIFELKEKIIPNTFINKKTLKSIA